MTRPSHAMAALPLLALALLFAAQVSAQTASCQLTYSGTTISTSTCTGSSPNYQNSIKRSATLTYSTSTGKFSGTMTVNLCPKTAYNRYSGVDYSTTVGSKPTCTSVTLPGTAYTTTPVAAPLRQAVAYSVSGANIFGPMDNGFSAGGGTSPDVCTNSKGVCAAGTDVVNCFSTMEVLCGTANVQYKYGLDDCGGHANPYHYHTDPVCEYTKTATGHSALVGYALDGRGLYGLYETTGVAAVTDACNGHWGDVPAYSGTDTDGTAITYPAATNVYHYHTSANAPFTIGCYGPPADATSTNKNDVTIAACKALYPSTTAGCGVSATTICTGKGLTSYYLDCPCFNYKNTDYYNGVYTVTSACTNCTGSCATGGTSTTNSKTTTTTTSTTTSTTPSTTTTTTSNTTTSTSNSTTTTTTTTTTSKPPPPPSPSPPPPSPAAQPTSTFKLTYANTPFASWTTTTLGALNSALATKMTIGSVVPTVTSTPAVARRRNLLAGSTVSSTATFPAGTSTSTVSSANTQATSGTVTVTGITEVVGASLTSTSVTSSAVALVAKPLMATAVALVAALMLVA